MIELYKRITVLIVIVSCASGGLYMARRVGLLDRPGSDIKPPRAPVPTMQGVMLVVIFFVAVGVIAPEYYTGGYMDALILGGGLITMMTVLDEWCFLFPFYKKTALVVASYPLTRLIVMVVVAVIAYSVGGVRLDEIVVGSSVITLSGWMALLLTIGRFVLFINAINRIDGINGISTGSSSIGFLTIYLLITLVVLPLYPSVEVEVLIAQQLSLLLFLISLCYAMIERKPLGLVRDCGVMFLGYMLAYLSLLGGGKIGIMMVVLALVMFDAGWVILHRMVVLRKNPLKGDLTHLHHRLLALGRSRSEVRVFVWSWSLCLMVIMLLQGDQTIHKIIIFVMMFVIFFSINVYLFWIKKLPSELKR